MARNPRALRSVEPFTPEMIADVLRAMPDERLSIIGPTPFQTWPTKNIVPGNIIRELIANEKAYRRRKQ